MRAFDGIGDGLPQGNGEANMTGATRGQKGNARKGNTTTSQHNERTRGRCNERTPINDDATTSWHNKTTRGQHNKTTRQREGGASRGDATTSRHDERMRGRHGAEPDKSICQHGLLLTTTTRRATRRLPWRGQLALEMTETTLSWMCKSGAPLGTFSTYQPTW